MGLLLTKHARDALALVEKISARFIKADFNGNPRSTIINVYFPTLLGGCGSTSAKKEQEKEVKQFYQDLEETIRKVPSHNPFILLGDIDAGIGTNIVKYNYHLKTNYNGHMLFDPAQATNLVIRSTSFRKRQRELMTHLNSKMVPNHNWTTSWYDVNGGDVSKMWSPITVYPHLAQTIVLWLQLSSSVFVPT